MNYYEHHLGDYARDTTHLTALEHGVYRLLLDRYYTREEGIPEEQAYRVALARTDDERAAVDAILGEYFKLVDGLWINNKAEEEIKKARSRINAATENGKRGGRPKKNPDESKSKAKITQPFQSGSENKTQLKAHQTPITIHQERKDADESALPLSEQPDAELYRRGREVLGANASGLVTRAKKQLGIPRALALVISSSDRDDPKAFFAAAVRNAERPPEQPPPEAWIGGAVGSRTF